MTQTGSITVTLRCEPTRLSRGLLATAVLLAFLGRKRASGVFVDLAVRAMPMRAERTQ